MTKSRRIFLSMVVVAACLVLQVFSSEGRPNLNERLGYAATDKLLIVHADDVGLSHAVNTASFKALESGRVTSASVMVPCPWLQEVADYVKKNPETDLGIHLVLSSEWHAFNWGPVASKSEVPSLINPLGYFQTIRNALAQMDPREVEIELREQIKLARSIGINPTHLDSHQLLLFFRPGLFQAYLNVGRELGIPILLSKSIHGYIRERMGKSAPDWDSYLQPDDILIDNVLSISPEEAEESWPAFYSKAIKGLKPGVTQLIVHVGMDSEEMRGMAGDSAFGSSWRQKEFDYLTGVEFGELLVQENVKLITWREIAKLSNFKQNE